MKITLKNENNPKRVELLREIARAKETAKATIQFWDHPVHILLRETIASAKRATIYGNLAAAGPAELTAFASLAIAAGDKDMAGAIVSRLHEMPASARPVSPRSIADALVGELSRELTGGLLEVDSLLTESALANRMMEQERSGSNGLASVELALKHRRLAEVNGARIEDDGHEAE